MRMKKNIARSEAQERMLGSYLSVSFGNQKAEAVVINIPTSEPSGTFSNVECRPWRTRCAERHNEKRQASNVHRQMAMDMENGTVRRKRHQSQKVCDVAQRGQKAQVSISRETCREDPTSVRCQRTPRT